MLFRQFRRILQLYEQRSMSSSQVNVALQDGKLCTPAFKAISSELRHIAELFQRRGHELRLVGGVVRDLLLGIEPKDVDLATDATPAEMVALCEAHRLRYYETGLKHGTITLHVNRKDVEVTTLRIDRVTDGRHAEVDFTKDWRLDAERRDLTINAMYLDFDGVLFDYFEGQRDLKERRVAFVGDARARIKEDYLRILRYFRFYGRIGTCADAHDADTLGAIQENANGLRTIATERIWMEMSKIIVGNFAPDMMTLMYRLGVAKAIGLPKNGSLEEFRIVHERMKGYSPNPVTLLVSLDQTANDMQELAKHWRLSNAEKRLGAFIVKNRELKKDDVNPVKPYQTIIASSLSDLREEYRKYTVELLRYVGQHELVGKIADWQIPIFPVSGGDLVAIGMKPGPAFKEIMTKLKMLWIEKDFEATKEELLDSLKLHA